MFCLAETSYIRRETWIVGIEYSHVVIVLPAGENGRDAEFMSARLAVLVFLATELLLG